MNKTGFKTKKSTETKTLYHKFTAFIERYRIHAYATLAILTIILGISAGAFPSIKQYISENDLIQYITLIVLLDLASTFYFQQRTESTFVMRNQDETMSKLIEAVAYCRSEKADLLEYAGATTLPLIRAIQREDVPMRMLIKHPETITGIQKQRMIVTLDTLYNSIFQDHTAPFEIRCYRLPYSLRARRLGNELLELGWLTPDIEHETAYGHGNPSILVDLSTSRNDYLREFFNRTFNDLWEHDETEDGLVVLNRLKSSLKSLHDP